MTDIQKLALEAYPEKLVTVGDSPELWDENEQYRECWIEGYNKALTIQLVSQCNELVCDCTPISTQVSRINGRYICCTCNKPLLSQTCG